MSEGVLHSCLVGVFFAAHEYEMFQSVRETIIIVSLGRCGDYNGSAVNICTGIGHRYYT